MQPSPVLNPFPAPPPDSQPHSTSPGASFLKSVSSGKKIWHRLLVCRFFLAIGCCGGLRDLSTKDRDVIRVQTAMRSDEVSLGHVTHKMTNHWRQAREKAGLRASQTAISSTDLPRVLEGHRAIVCKLQLTRQEKLQLYAEFAVPHNVTLAEWSAFGPVEQGVHAVAALSVSRSSGSTGAVQAHRSAEHGRACTANPRASQLSDIDAAQRGGAQSCKARAERKRGQLSDLGTSEHRLGMPCLLALNNIIACWCADGECLCAPSMRLVEPHPPAGWHVTLESSDWSAP